VGCASAESFLLILMRTLEIREGEKRYLTRDELSTEQALAIDASGFVKIQFPSPANRQQFVLEAANVVGLLPLPGDLLIRITPKVPIANLFGMLEMVHELASFRFYEGIGHVEAIEDIYARLARLLARRVSQRVRRGLYAAYLPVEEASLTVRGRIDVAESVRLRARGSVALHCVYCVLTVDIEDNQILLWALDRIPRLKLSSGQAPREVHIARRALLGSVRLTEVSPSVCRNRTYNRLNADYELMHALARFFLERMGPGVAYGEHAFLPFTVNVATLFQEYVVTTLRRHLPPGLSLSRQYMVAPEGDFQLQFSLDIAIRHERSGAVLAVVDAKYKKHPKPSPDDAQQVIAYAAQVDAREAVLVYPFDVLSPGSVRIGRERPIRLTNLSLPLDRDLESASATFALSLFQMLS
jgi:5-methylcytosine-specific restriction enzyme subunit McrC